LRTAIVAFRLQRDSSVLDLESSLRMTENGERSV
jgi:hypothetical protein